MRVFAAAALALLLSQPPAPPPSALPDFAVAKLSQSLDAARAQRRNVWRDTRAIHGDGTVTAYVEIPRGDRQKWEFDVARNRRVVDRVIPRDIGGYPVNYGFVTQTISYDGDPFDALVLGRALRGGALVRGEVVGIMHMQDEKGLDSKVVLSPVIVGKRLHDLTGADRARLTAFFAKYNAHEPGGFSRVTGWGSPEEGLAYVRQTHAFFTARRGSQRTAPSSQLPASSSRLPASGPGGSRRRLEPATRDSLRGASEAVNKSSTRSAPTSNSQSTRLAACALKLPQPEMLQRPFSALDSDRVLLGVGDGGWVSQLFSRAVCRPSLRRKLLRVQHPA